MNVGLNARTASWSLWVLVGTWILQTVGCESATCAGGLAEVDGACIESACSSACGENEFCETSIAPAACACSPGYEGNTCAFGGLIEDPEFALDRDSSPWALTQGATVENTASTPLGVGKGVLLADVICNAGRITQEVQMPSVEGSQPLVAQLDYLANGVHGVALGFGSAWTRLAPTATSEWRHDVRVCLGEASYGPPPGGGPVMVQLSASERLANCLDGSLGSGGQNGPRIEIDRFDILPATRGECPAPGAVFNSAANVNDQPWRFLKEGDAEAALTEGAGRQGTAGARLYREAGVSGRATMSTLVSVPMIESPAIRFWWRGTRQQTFDVHAGTLVSLADRGRQVDTLIGTVDTGFPNVSFVSRLYCLPPWTRGTVIEWSFSLPEEDTEEAVLLAVDELELTTEESCGNDEALLDGGFESAPRPWFGTYLSSGDEAIFMREDDSLANNGRGVMELTYWTNAPRVSMETYVRIPDDDPNPALIFYSRSPSEPSIDVRWFLGRSGFLSAPVATTSTWERNEICLPAAWSGRWFRMSVRAVSGTPPGTAIEQERVYLDDFALGSCSTLPTIAY
jgi:hypothetical protein